MMDWMYAPENIRKQMEEEGHIYYIAFKGDIPAGYVSIQPEGEDLFHLQKIYVLPSFQGKHLGKLLFEQAVKAIKEIHPTPCEMHLNVNRNNKALRFYEYMGMKKVDEGHFTTLRFISRMISLSSGLTRKDSVIFWSALL